MWTMQVFEAIAFPMMENIYIGEFLFQSRPLAAFLTTIFSFLNTDVSLEVYAAMPSLSGGKVLTIRTEITLLETLALCFRSNSRVPAH